jgi:hypothetical protein
MEIPSFSLLSMGKVASLSKKVLSSYKNLPDKKQYIEFFTALLSVPVLVTVIMLNILNLRSANKINTPPPTPQPKQQYIYIPITSNPNTNKDSSSNETNTSTSNTLVTPTTTEPCKPAIGPVDITSPAEGDTVTDNPTSIIISYKTGEYCAVVWSYRINNGDWSAYDDKSIALYNLPQGKIKVDVKVKSIVSGDEQILTRSFIYKGTATSVTPTATPTVSPTISPDTKNSSSSANQP